MSIFVDTSALIAFLDAEQPRHAEVIDTWDRAVADRAGLGVFLSETATATRADSAPPIAG